MKCMAEVKNIYIDEDGYPLIFIKPTSPQAMEEAQALERGELYVLDIHKQKDKRTLQQNAYLWAMVGEMNRKQNGTRNSEDDIKIYLDILERSGAKCDYLEVIPEAYERLKELSDMRLITVVQKRRRNGVETYMCKCFYGTSKMDTIEMGTVIDQALIMAEEYGIETDYWKGLLK